MLDKIIKSIKTCILSVLQVFPIDSRKILFFSYYGKGYGDNPKYIAEELHRRNLGYKLYWAIDRKEDANSLPSYITPIDIHSVTRLFHYVTAKCVVTNCRMGTFPKRNGQYYIQTWHGDIGFKKCERDAMDALNKEYIAGAIRDSQMADLFLSGNDFFCQRVRDAYWYSGEIACCGYPRRDILYKNDMDCIKRVKASLGIDPKEHVLLYAPTFRNKMQAIDLSVYDMDWKGVMQALQERFGGTWRSVIRLHPNIAKLASALALPEDIIDATDYPDMQELLYVSDCCITDYSSALFDFAVTGKPGFIFATDFEEYKKDRDVYYDLEETPFPIASANAELIENIAGFDVIKYAKKHDVFYRDKIGMYEEGHASEYVADRIDGVCFAKKDD